MTIDDNVTLILALQHENIIYLRFSEKWLHIVMDHFTRTLMFDYNGQDIVDVIAYPYHNI